MGHICESTGKLTPTGKHYPEIIVRAAISHEEMNIEWPTGVKLKQKRSVVHSVIPQNGETLAPGDFDLVMGSKLIRLKKLPDSPEWLVLSSPTA